MSDEWVTDDMILVDDDFDLEFEDGEDTEDSPGDERSQEPTAG